ncbi:response regulator transcription factor [Ensifer sp.]|jgi:DNA-binding NarL/FixJ family response regulator|uniref:response regulator transcription factor n=1 Tax=Ensifer sp. TaxID=1872086 RepID=UPI002E15AE7D|nr:response regulator transcription factor [Ensifer sp.]
MTAPIRTVIVDDHPLVIVGARATVETTQDIVCVGAAGSGTDALALIGATSPDVSVIDISLPDMSGLSLAEEILKQKLSTYVVVMTEHQERSYAQQALQIGVKGFIQKCSAPEHLLLAVRSVTLGGLYLDPPTAQELTRSTPGPGAQAVRMAGMPGLTRREQDVLRLVALGYSNKEIGARTNVSVKSIETYKARATEKLQLHTRAQIVHFALTHGWMSAI